MEQNNNNDNNIFNNANFENDENVKDSVHIDNNAEKDNHLKSKSFDGLKHKHHCQCEHHSHHHSHTQQNCNSEMLKNKCCEKKTNSNKNNAFNECSECANETCASYYEELEKKVKEYILTAQQIQADFDNYRKKTFQQIADARLDGQIETIKKIIPVLDSFAGAKKMINDENLLQGFILVENQILGALKSMGVEKISAIGEIFNPHLHNALATANDKSLANDVIKEEYQAGYKLGDKIIRYSQVIVNKLENE